MDTFNMIIIGSGPAGLSSAIYANRAGYKTLVIEKTGPGGQIMLTDFIDNYPGFENGISGFDLQDNLYKQAKKFGLNLISDAVTSVEKENDIFLVKTSKNNIYKTQSVIIASGASYRLLGAEGESRLTGKGVTYCGTCDGPFYRGRKVVIVGGGDTALTEALFIAKFASEIIIVHRKDKFRAVDSLVKQVGKLESIKYRMNSTVKSINGENQVESITITDTKTGNDEEIKTDGVFIFIGQNPNTNFLTKPLIDDSGYIPTDDKMKTSTEGIFAAGDVRADTFRQIICACSDGAKAAHYAGEYTDKLNGSLYI